MVFLSFNLCWCLLYCMYIVGYHGWYWLSAIVAKVWVTSRLGRGAVVRGDGHCWGSSDGCFLGFRVSMRDWTPRFTLVVTRRVTESADGEEEEPARWEGGRATRHFWYRSTQAAWTASDTLPALGSHQNTWHWKCWLPVSIMKANEWTSRPTPMKDRKRTRHSTSTSSSSSFSLMTATVVSAMLSITGVQSSLPVEDTRLSMAPFMMSIPIGRDTDVIPR